MVAKNVVLPVPAEGTVRQYRALTDGGQLYALHTATDGSQGHVEQWVPGTGWVDAPWEAGTILGFDPDPSMQPVDANQAEKIAADVRTVPPEDLRKLSGGSDPQVCQGVGG